VKPLTGRTGLALALAAPAALGIGAAQAAGADPHIAFGAFGRSEATAGTDMTVRFQARNLEAVPLGGVTVVLTISDQLGLAALDCGPLGTLLPEGDGCAYAAIPARTAVKLTATVNICCPFGGDDDVAVTQGWILGTGIGAGVRTRIRS
jgi:hypothetical protein